MKKYRPIFLVVCTVVALTMVGYLLVRHAHFDVLQPSGVVAEKQRSLLIFTLVLSAIVVVPVFTMLGLFAWRYRADAHARHEPDWSSNSVFETIWWAIPILIIGILAVVTWQTSHSLDPYKPLASTAKPIEVQVVALQWKWLFIYPDLGIATVNKLPIPENVPIHFTLTADAPMSAFWVPALGSQIYAMNGMSSQLNLMADHTGTFTGYSTNINGKGYADMKFTVTAMSSIDFASWTIRAQNSPDMMDESTYQTLAKPGMADQKEYMLMDKTLYDTIVAKYMKGMSSSDDTSQSHGTMNMKTMEGM